MVYLGGLLSIIGFILTLYNRCAPIGETTKWYRYIGPVVLIIGFIMIVSGVIKEDF
jgi:hypothetical protein